MLQCQVHNNLQKYKILWSAKYRTANKMGTSSRDFTKFTVWCHFTSIFKLTKCLIYLRSEIENGTFLPIYRQNVLNGHEYGLVKVFINV